MLLLQNIANELLQQIASPVSTMQSHIEEQRRCLDMMKREKALDVSAAERRFEREKKQCLKSLKSLQEAANVVVADEKDSAKNTSMLRRRR